MDAVQRIARWRGWMLLVALIACPRWLMAAEPGHDVFPGDEWLLRAPTEAGLDEALLAAARDYALSGEGSGHVVHRGFVVMSWGDPRRRYDLKSTTKSFGAVALGLALADKKLSLDDRAVDRHPEFGVPPESNREKGWLERITLWHLATQTAGFAKPGGYEPLLFEPGTRWGYSDGGPNWLAECVTLAYRRDVAELMHERVFAPLGISPEDLVWRKNQYRPHMIDGLSRREFGSGISANVDAMARFGYLMLREGRWRNRRLLPAEYVRQMVRTDPKVAGLPIVAEKDYGRASDHYGLLWWNNADGTLADVPRDAFWSWGLYDGLIIVVPSLDLVVARVGKSLPRSGGDHYAVLEPLIGPIARAARGATSPPAASSTTGAASPCPPSPVIAGIDFAPAETIVRFAKGSDNWPITRDRNGTIYGAYGDGYGFARKGPKLSLGLATLSGSPPNITGANLAAPNAEAAGDGPRGRKASGLVALGDTLYMLARNTGNAQLAWSDDGGHAWTWADWKFTESFGCPTFLNGAPEPGDGFVYVYSHDSASAYQRADRMVLARVPHQRIRQRDAYEFFVRLDEAGAAAWSPDVNQRGAVFSDPGNCYRSAVSYHAPTGRYLWCQTGRGEDPRFKGGLAIYDAPQPWGPWTTVFYAETWDTGPGETSSLPPCYHEPDGRTLWLVFSGDDCLSLRKAVLRVR